MNTKIKKIIPVFLLAIVFLIIWFFINGKYFDHYENSIVNLKRLSAEVTGYNYVLLHSSVYALFYFLFLNSYLPFRWEQYLTRMKRKTFYFYMIKKMFLYSVIFVFVFICIRIMFTMKNIDISFLFDVNYFLGSFISFIILVIYYAFLGSGYMILFFRIRNQYISLLIATLVSIGWGVDTYLSNRWGPIEDIIVMNRLIDNMLNVEWVLLAVMKLMFLLILLFYIGKISFSNKDVID